MPVVLGLGPRVGARTLATALHAYDEDLAGMAAPLRGAAHLAPLDAASHPACAVRGPRVGAGASGGTCRMAADVAVCSGDDASLRRAEALRGAPVLVVVLVADGPPPSRARQRELGLRHGAVAVLPYVPHWAGLADAPDEAAVLLAQSPEHLPPVLRAYAGGLRLVVTALMRGGHLHRPEPPPLIWAPCAPGPRQPAFPVAHRPAPAPSPARGPRPPHLAPATAPTRHVRSPQASPRTRGVDGGGDGPVAGSPPSAAGPPRVPSGQAARAGARPPDRAARGEAPADHGRAPSVQSVRGHLGVAPAAELDDEAIENEALAASSAPPDVRTPSSQAPTCSAMAG